jgi:hypothetical protein
VGITIGVLVLVFAGIRAVGSFEHPATGIDLNARSNNVAPGEVIGAHVGDQGNSHIPVGQKGTYSTLPPTSGAHWNQAGVAPAPWGIKDSTLPNEVTTHNLEHGGIVIGYGPTLLPDDTTKLKSLVRALMGVGFPKIILEPYPLASGRIALTAWTWILELSVYDEGQIIKFTRAHYRGPDAPEPNGF